jgi:hypothetical protein
MSNPYESPQPLPSMLPTGSGVDREKIRRVAQYQKYVLYSLLANIAINVVSFGVAGQGGAAAVAVIVVSLAVVVCGMVAIFHLARELMGTGIAVLCTVLMLIPCVSLINLLVVNQKATTYLQQHGIKVGLMGANLEQL